MQSRGVACEGRIGVGTASDTILKADSGGIRSGDVGGEASSGGAAAIPVVMGTLLEVGW